MRALVPIVLVECLHYNDTLEVSNFNYFFFLALRVVFPVESMRGFLFRTALVLRLLFFLVDDSTSLLYFLRGSKGSPSLLLMLHCRGFSLYLSRYFCKCSLH